MFTKLWRSSVLGVDHICVAVIQFMDAFARGPTDIRNNLYVGRVAGECRTLVSNGEKRIQDGRYR
jgi:hypothetical protein